MPGVKQMWGGSAALNDINGKWGQLEAIRGTKLQSEWREWDKRVSVNNGINKYGRRRQRNHKYIRGNFSTIILILTK